ncbi:hypothetical protein M6D93_14795 [Jatrophihabitans telluris]|uniref:Glycosyltransferase family 2 protein n=1 Tax=Jatrophihabitans telluris TaxID=2038343 RepID=A0ABY4QV92_9ACTN|nr:hypothetical protein [Jatrophihabitans telluris]UQX87559.1 hypothetical protein M6D93_14795 [Jatrophihabitans telluris]
MTELEQIAFLSNRPDVLAETLDYVRHFMPWLRRAVVLAPAATIEPMRRSLARFAPWPIELVAEPDVLGAGEQVPVDHGARNALLRLRLAERGPLDELFLASDDDYRPLKDVAVSEFLSDGRMHSYASYDLALWRQNESSYDRVQHASYLALSYLGADHLCYAAHMPQVIDRQIFVAAFAAAGGLSGSTAFCEWSLPLNYGRFIAPDRYSPPRTFRTVGWPQYPHQWPFWRRPEELSFENFYPESYVAGQLFAGIDTALDAQDPQRQAFSKISRWYAFDLAAGRLRFQPGVQDPWRTSAGRKALFGVLRRVRKLYEYVALEERTQLVELAGELNRLQQQRSDDERARPDRST